MLYSFDNTYSDVDLNPLGYLNTFFTHLKLCLVIATHNFQWVKTSHICLIWDKTFASLDVKTLIPMQCACAKHAKCKLVLKMFNKVTRGLFLTIIVFLIK